MRSQHRDADRGRAHSENLVGLLPHPFTQILALAVRKRRGVDREFERDGTGRLENFRMKFARRLVDDVADVDDTRENIVQPLAPHPRFLIVEDENEARRLREHEAHKHEQNELAFQATRHHMRSTVPTNL